MWGEVMLSQIIGIASLTSALIMTPSATASPEYGTCTPNSTNGVNCVVTEGDVVRLHLRALNDQCALLLRLTALKDQTREVTDPIRRIIDVGRAHRALVRVHVAIGDCIEPAPVIPVPASPAPEAPAPQTVVSTLPVTG
jgi:hypothetical protein